MAFEVVHRTSAPVRLEPAPPRTRASVLRLYLEELKALPRGRFALGGAAALLALVAFLAVAIAPEWPRAFGIFAFLIVPAFVAPLAAHRLASARATRFHHSLFTAPVAPATWLAANVLVALTVGALYLAATIPVLAVFAAHLGTSGEVFTDLLPAGLGLVLFGAALGTFLGVAFTGRSVAAPVGLAAAAMLVSVMAGFFLSQVLAATAPSAFLVAVLHLFPHVNLLGATASGLHGGLVPADPLRPALAVAVGIVGLLALAAWAYLRHQGPEDWESPPRRRALLALAVVAVVLAPAVVAGSSDYERAPPSVPQIHLPLPPPTGLYAALALPGADASRVEFLNPALTAYEHPLTAGQANQRELVLLFPVGPDGAVKDLTLRVTIPGRDADRSYLDHQGTFPRVAAQETARLPGTGLAGPAEGLVLRVPLAITLQDPRGFTKNFYLVHVHATYQVEGQEEDVVGHAQFPVEAVVPTAGTELLLASAPLPLLLAGGAAARRLRVG